MVIPWQGKQLEAKTPQEVATQGTTILSQCPSSSLNRQGFQACLRVFACGVCELPPPRASDTVCSHLNVTSV